MTPYLKKRSAFPPQITTPPDPNLGLIVTIPAYDEPNLLDSLQSLYHCSLPKDTAVEVIIVINQAEDALEDIIAQNQNTLKEAERWAASNPRPGLQFFFLHHSLPARFAGVGLARKIAMDEACWRLEKVKQSNGIIACFDADSRCDENYFQAIVQHFNEDPKCPAVSIYYEHPLQGNEYSHGVYEAITSYELHLRYYVQAQSWAGFPHAFHTVGSSMAVRCSAYQKQGGMNKRKAGEDFYFIHKFTPLKGFANLAGTRVIPASRPSHRVPFGTGKAIQEMLDHHSPYQSYPPESFIELKDFLSCLPELYNKNSNWEKLQISPTLLDFLKNQNFSEKLAELQLHSASYSTFLDRFFRWFNAFQVMKYLHFARSKGRMDIPVSTAASWLLKERNLLPKQTDDFTLLLRYRSLDRGEI